MDIAIVTGASSSLGLAISRRLIQLGFRVYGLGGDYKDCELQNVNFRPVSCDLADPAAVESACRKIIDKEKGVYLLVNNAKYFGKSPFEQMELAELERILRINLLCPLVLMRVLADSLKTLQGYLIQIGAAYAESSSGGAAGAASAGGLKWMGDMLFHEYRTSGVRVCHLSPEPNRARDARLRYRKGARPEATIDPEAIAQAVEQILQSPYGNVVTEMVIRPLRIDEPELDPVVKIPYPDPQPIPYTVPREMVEAEEQLEEEEWQKQQQEKRKRRSRRKSKPEPDKGEPAQADRDTKPQEPAPKPEPAEPKLETSNAEEAHPRRKSRRKPRPPRVSVGFHDKQPEKVPADGAGNETRQKPDDKAADQAAPETPARKAVKKSARKAAKNPARKATSQAKKKVATKNSARKTAAKSATRKAARKRTAKVEKDTGKDSQSD